MSELTGERHLPHAAPIDAYGNGGFRFGGMSHRGSILCLPAGIWAWPPAEPREIDDRALKPILDAGEGLDFVLLGTGMDLRPLPPHLRERFRALNVSVDVMPTGAAVRTYNVMVVESRRVAAGLIAVD